MSRWTVNNLDIMLSFILISCYYTLASCHPSTASSPLLSPSALINSWLHPLNRPSSSFTSSSSRAVRRSYSSSEAAAAARAPSRPSLALRAAPSHCSSAWDSAPSCRSMASQPPAAVCSAVDAALRRTRLRRSLPSSSRHSTRSWGDGEGGQETKLLRKLWLRKLQPLDVQAVLFKAAYIDYIAVSCPIWFYITLILCLHYYLWCPAFSFAITEFSSYY